MSRGLHGAVIAAVFAVGACAGAPAHEEHVLVKLVRPASDGASIAQHASEVAKVPARYVSAVDERWHALVLTCPDSAACAQAVERLRADTSTYEGVDVDARRRVHS